MGYHTLLSFMIMQPQRVMMTDPDVIHDQETIEGYDDRIIADGTKGVLIHGNETIVGYDKNQS